METKEVKLGDIVKYNKGYAFKSSEYTDEGVMVVRVTDFTLDSISDADAVYLAPDDRYDKFILKTNDILIQTVGSWANNPNSIVGKVVRVPKGRVPKSGVSKHFRCLKEVRLFPKI